ncbi:MAG TPA: colicin D domain-containing protein [Acetobacteraceae bacterium]|nr:colicin D domain-containing protein [Acetobacteraceae bacterium]
MPEFQRLTEADLRAAMRDPRYWQTGHPERAAYAGWVGEGWQALHPPGQPVRAAVWVRAYVRDGHAVSAHWRSAPARAGDTSIILVARPPRTDPNTGMPLMPGQRGSPLEGGVGGGGGSGAGSRSVPQTWRPPAGVPSPAAASSPPGRRAVEFQAGQSQSKYKHASEFGLPRNWNRENGARFEEVLRAHVAHPETLRIVGTYRRQPVIHYLDPRTGLNVMTDRAGAFRSAWQLSSDQFRNVWQRGSL